MMNPKTQTIVASTVLALSIGVSIALIPMKPDGSAVVIVTMAAFILVWNVSKVLTRRKCPSIDWLNSKTRHEILFAIILASLLALGSISATLAKELGFFDGDLVKRIIGVDIGLMLMVFGNYIPKKGTHQCGSCESNTSASLKTQRFVGWIIVLGGLLYAAAWIFLDLDQAGTAVLFTFPSAIVIIALSRFIYLRVSKTDDHAGSLNGAGHE